MVCFRDFVKVCVGRRGENQKGESVESTRARRTPQARRRFDGFNRCEPISPRRPFSRTGAKRLQCVTFDGDLWICAKVDQQSELAVRDSEVIQNLSPVFIGESVHGFEFQNDLAETVNVRLVGLLDRLALVVNRQFLLRLEWNAAISKLPLKTLLVHLFVPGVAHLLVNVKHRALNGVHLIPIKQLVFHRISSTDVSGFLDAFPCSINPCHALIGPRHQRLRHPLCA